MSRRRIASLTGRIAMPLYSSFRRLGINPTQRSRLGK
jgi:hypothetical protein